MKTLTAFIALLICTCITYANEIDRLQTRKDVQKFLVQKLDSSWKEIVFFDTVDTSDTTGYGKGKFIKIDLDNNGLTDLIINGKYFLAVIDSGNGHYAHHLIDKGGFLFRKYTLKNIIYKEKTPLLLIAGYKEYTATSDNSKIDTLVLFNGGFCEYSPSPDEFKIQEINFSTSPCFGTCPVFQLTIKGDRTATYDAQHYNDQNGKFKTTIDTNSFNSIVQTINYIKITSLKDDYSVNWTDDQTARLKIKFNNGLVKNISDYGEIGTFGLGNLYNQLFALRNTQNWKKIK